MQIVKKLNNLDGCEIDNRYTIYMSRSEFVTISQLLMDVVIIAPTPEEEIRRVDFLAHMPDVVKKRLILICDEFVKLL